jgi:ATP-dependent Clp protease ATP-binding subunit ClpA
MNEMFTEAARKAIEYARDEASRLKHDYIGTEHLLLGLIRLGEGQAVEIIGNLGLELEDLKASIEEVVQPSGGTMTMGQLPLTARAKKTLEARSSRKTSTPSTSCSPCSRTRKGWRRRCFPPTKSTIRKPTKS